MELLMKRRSLIRFILPVVGMLMLTPVFSQSPLVYEGDGGLGQGKHIVFLSGDHEYRSEETMPALARILTKHHGFKCTVLFNVDPESGEIVPGNSHSPGMEALGSVDLAVIFLRFQNFPPEQMKHFAAYLNRGGPVVGLRTATHAFRIPEEGEFHRFSYDHKGDDYLSGFGHQVLGQTWVGHYGRNHRQSTRIDIVPDQAKHPILRGVKDIWVQAGGYVGKPVDGEVLTTAQPLNGMTPDSPADSSKSPMPSEWTRTYQSRSGETGRVFTSLYGASEDLLKEGYRRMLVNGVFWALGMEEAIEPDLDVSFVGPYRPNTFGNRRYAAGVKPSAYVGFASPIPAEGTSAARENDGDERRAEPRRNERRRESRRQRNRRDSEANTPPHALTEEPPEAVAKRAQGVAPPAVGERIVLLGNGLAERDVYYHRIETELSLRYPDKKLFFRNMGHVGDTPGFRPHPSRSSQWAFPGAEEFHPELDVHHGTGFYPTPDQWLTHLQADTIVAFFGYNESFDGPGRVANFEAELDAWVRHSLSKTHNREAAPGSCWYHRLRLKICRASGISPTVRRRMPI